MYTNILILLLFLMYVNRSNYKYSVNYVMYNIHHSFYQKVISSVIKYDGFDSVTSISVLKMQIRWMTLTCIPNKFSQQKQFIWGLLFGETITLHML